MENEIHRQDPEVSVPPSTKYKDDDDDDQFPLVSPLNPAETFFLSSDLITNRISAGALASQLGRQASSSASGLSTTGTDDFHSAAGSETEFCVDSTVTEKTKLTTEPFLFGKDILIQSHLEEEQQILEEDEESNNSVEIKMTTDTTNTTTKPDESYLDAAQNVYGTAKNVWAWGKSVPVIGFFPGATEAVASKAVGLVGTSLEDIDKNVITPVAEGVDSKVLNPVAEMVVGYTMGGVSNVHGVVDGVVGYTMGGVSNVQGAVEGVVGFVTGGDKKKEEEKAAAEQAETPEVTTTVPPPAIKA